MLTSVLMVLLTTAPTQLDCPSLQVFAFGHRLTPPYEFSAEDDVVTLNGFPFHPLPPPPREGLDSTSIAKWEERATILVAVQGALRKEAAERVADASSRAEALECVREVYALSKDVLSATVVEPGVLVVFAAAPDTPFHESFRHELSRFDPAESDRSVPPSIARRREANVDEATALRQEFAAACSNGGLYAFGSGYRFAKRPGEAWAMQRLIESAQQQGRLPAQGLAGPDGLPARRFLEDLTSPVPTSVARRQAGLP